MNVLSVVIPAFNEEGGIAQIIERVLSIRPRLTQAGVDDLELIVVDDGSVTGPPPSQPAILRSASSVTR